MVIELGHFCAIISLVFAAFLFFVIAQSRGKPLDRILPHAMYFTRWNFALLSFALATLSMAYLRSDFSVANVAANSHTLKPWLYKLTGVWGNHEGSLLFWCWIVSAYGFLFAALSKSLDPAWRTIVLGVQSVILFGFLAFMLCTSNPFARAFPIPPEGNDLNPILQDPGLAFHPPLLYLGYIGTSLLLGFAVAALLRPNQAPDIMRAMRPFAALQWAFLTLGIALGSYWAYYELGWGGWWFWDPVENASLMPWLLSTALLHSIMVAERGGFLHWTILLAIVTFGLSVIGTFLVRSGILTSVHAFANDPLRGAYLLMILGVILGGSLLLYALRAPILHSRIAYHFFSREAGIAINSIVLSTLCFTVFLGTLYPLFIELANGGKISVGPPYFTMTFIPISIPMIAVMGLAGVLKIHQTPAAFLLRETLKIMAIAAILCTGLILILSYNDAFGLLSIALGAWLIAGAAWIWIKSALSGTGLRYIPMRTHTMAIGHLGLGLCIVGMAASSLWLIEDTVRMKKNDAVELAGYRFELLGFSENIRDNYAFVSANLLVENTDRAMYLHPEKRIYPVQNITTTEVARDVSWRGDIYTALAEITADQSSAILRISYHPFVSWIWIGGAIMALAGFLQAGYLWIGAKIPSALMMPVYTLSGMGLTALLAAAIAVYLAIGSPLFAFIL